MFVIGRETYSDIKFLGASVKPSVERPVSGKKPDLAFKAPTCSNRDLGFILHGKVGLLLLAGAGLNFLL